MTVSFHLDEDACSCHQHIVDTWSCMPLYWGSADGEQGGMAAVCESFALVIRSLTYCRFCCYTLSMTFNREFTGTAFGLQSELRAKMEKVVIPFAIKVTIFLLDCFSIVSCRCFLQEMAIAGGTVLFAQFSSLVHLHWIYTYLSSVTLTPPLAFLFLSFRLFQSHACTIERTIVLFSNFLLTQP